VPNRDLDIRELVTEFLCLKIRFNADRNPILKQLFLFLLRRER